MGILAGREVEAKKKVAKAVAEPEDQIVIDAQIPVTQGPVERFIVTKHYNRSYIYAERQPGKPVMLIDASQPAHPVVLSELAPETSSGSLVAVAGTAALSSDAAPGAGAPAVQTIRIMDFSDPAHPKVTRQFDDVTAVAKSGNLILLANPEGIWILSQHLAEDPAVEAAYAHQVVYAN